MRKSIKSLIVALAIISSLIITASFTIIPQLGTPGGTPVDFYGTSKEISLNETITVAKQYNLSIYLPFELPDDFECTAIYLKDSPFIAIVVYSAEGNKDYKTAELTIQITPSTLSPTYNDLISRVESSEYETALEINGWPVLVNEKAYVGADSETRNKYGDYTLLVTTWIDGMRYMLCCPTLTTNRAEQLVGNMRLLTL